MPIKLTPPPKCIQRLRSCERGMSTVEYVILMAFIVAGAVTTWQTIGGDVKAGLNAAAKDTAKIREGSN